MKLLEIVARGFSPRAWAMTTFRGDRRVVVKLEKKTSKGVRSYVAHSPQAGLKLSDVEFTEPILLK